MDQRPCADTSVLPLFAAEIYGFGKSEEFLGEFIRASGTQDKAKVATKFATLPWRFTSNSVVEACKVCNQPLFQSPDFSMASCSRHQHMF